MEINKISLQNLLLFYRRYFVVAQNKTWEEPKKMMATEPFYNTYL